MEDDEYGSEYSEDAFGKLVKKEIYQPEQRLERFNPLPTEDQMYWLHYYYKPYAKTYNSERCMSFDIDEKQDMIRRLTEAFSDPKIDK